MVFVVVMVLLMIICCDYCVAVLLVMLVVFINAVEMVLFDGWATLCFVRNLVFWCDLTFVIVVIQLMYFIVIQYFVIIVVHFTDVIEVMWCLVLVECWWCYCCCAIWWCSVTIIIPLLLMSWQVMHYLIYLFDCIQFTIYSIQPWVLYTLLLLLLILICYSLYCCCCDLLILLLSWHDFIVVVGGTVRYCWSILLLEAECYCIVYCVCWCHSISCCDSHCCAMEYCSDCLSVLLCVLLFMVIVVVMYYHYCWFAVLTMFPTVFLPVRYSFHLLRWFVDFRWYLLMEGTHLVLPLLIHYGDFRCWRICYCYCCLHCWLLLVVFVPVFIFDMCGGDVTLFRHSALWCYCCGICYWLNCCDYWYVLWTGEWCCYLMIFIVPIVIDTLCWGPTVITLLIFGTIVYLVFVITMLILLPVYWWRLFGDLLLLYIAVVVNFIVILWLLILLHVCYYSVIVDTLTLCSCLLHYIFVDLLIVWWLCPLSVQFDLLLDELILLYIIVILLLLLFCVIGEVFIVLIVRWTLLFDWCYRWRYCCYWWCQWWYIVLLRYIVVVDCLRVIVNFDPVLLILVRCCCYCVICCWSFGLWCSIRWPLLTVVELSDFVVLLYLCSDAVMGISTMVLLIHCWFTGCWRFIVISVTHADCCCDTDCCSVAWWYFLLLLRWVLFFVHSWWRLVLCSLLLLEVLMTWWYWYDVVVWFDVIIDPWNWWLLTWLLMLNYCCYHCCWFWLYCYYGAMITTCCSCCWFLCDYLCNLVEFDVVVVHLITAIWCHCSVVTVRCSELVLLLTCDVHFDDADIEYDDVPLLLLCGICCAVHSYCSLPRCDLHCSIPFGIVTLFCMRCCNCCCYLDFIYWLFWYLYIRHMWYNLLFVGDIVRPLMPFIHWWFVLIQCYYPVEHYDDVMLLLIVDVIIVGHYCYSWYCLYSWRMIVTVLFITVFWIAWLMTGIHSCVVMILIGCVGDLGWLPGYCYATLRRPFPFTVFLFYFVHDYSVTMEGCCCYYCTLPSWKVITLTVPVVADRWQSLLNSIVQSYYDLLLFAFISTVTCQWVFCCCSCCCVLFQWNCVVFSLLLFVIRLFRRIPHVTLLLWDGSCCDSYIRCTLLVFIYDLLVLLIVVDVIDSWWSGTLLLLFIDGHCLLLLLLFIGEFLNVLNIDEFDVTITFFITVISSIPLVDIDDVVAFCWCLLHC